MYPFAFSYLILLAFIFILLLMKRICQGKKISILCMNLFSIFRVPSQAQVVTIEDVKFFYGLCNESVIDDTWSDRQSFCMYCLHMACEYDNEDGDMEYF